MFQQLLTRTILSHNGAFRQSMTTDPERIDRQVALIQRNITRGRWHVATDETWDRNGQPFQLTIVRNPITGAVVTTFEYQEFPEVPADDPHAKCEHRKSLTVDHATNCPVWFGSEHRSCVCHYSDARCRELTGELGCQLCRLVGHGPEVPCRP